MPKVLIVDDDLATRVGLQQLVAGDGYDVITAADFRDGRRALEQDAPDALVVDLRLEGFNGLQLLHINPRPIPAIVVTGYPDDVLRAEARRLGAEYVVKPINPAQFLALLDRLVRADASRPERRQTRRRFVTGDVPLEVNGVPARLIDASEAGVRFEVYRPTGQLVPSMVTLSLPVQKIRVEARLVWSEAGSAGHWECGAALLSSSAVWAAFVTPHA
jgi:CheY-like chemotaxis protein